MLILLYFFFKYFPFLLCKYNGSIGVYSALIIGSKVQVSHLLLYFFYIWIYIIYSLIQFLFVVQSFHFSFVCSIFSKNCCNLAQFFRFFFFLFKEKCFNVQLDQPREKLNNPTAPHQTRSVLLLVQFAKRNDRTRTELTNDTPKCHI